MRIFTFLLFVLSFIDADTKVYYYDGEKKITLKPLQSLQRSYGEYDFYEDQKGKRVGVAKGILVAFRDEKNLQTYLLEFDASIKKYLGSGIYLLELKDKTKTIDAANALHEKEDVLFAHPDFLRQRKLR